MEASETGIIGSHGDVKVKKKKAHKKRAAPDSDIPTAKDKIGDDQGKAKDGDLVNDDLSEPTMGEKLANLNLLEENKIESKEKQELSNPTMPPSADSIHVLLKQALHADDHALLLECLYNQDHKVIAKSISELNTSNVLRLLHSLISVIQTRGAILVCALPWLKCLLLQHASGIMSHESSLRALNSLYQLIESRVTTFNLAVKLSSCLNILYTGVIDDEIEENQTQPVIFEDYDESDEESEEAAMETKQDSQDDEPSDGTTDVDNGIDNIDDDYMMD